MYRKKMFILKASPYMIQKRLPKSYLKDMLTLKHGKHYKLSDFVIIYNKKLEDTSPHLLDLVQTENKQQSIEILTLIQNRWTMAYNSISEVRQHKTHYFLMLVFYKITKKRIKN